MFNFGIDSVTAGNHQSEIWIMFVGSPYRYRYERGMSMTWYLV